MKILVTGGAGFIGSHIVDQLLNEGVEVVVVDNLSTGYRENVASTARFYEVDVTEIGQLQPIFKAEKPEVVVHLAAQKSVTASVEDPIFDAQQNILGSIHLMEAARDFGVKKFVFASTGGALYGETESIPSGERVRTLPESPYGIAKLAVEHYLRYYGQTHNLRSAVLRLANVYGPRQDPHGEAGVVAIFCQKALADEPLTVFGDGRQTRDYVFVSDVANAFCCAARHDGNLVVNIGTSEESSVLDIISHLNLACGRELKIQHQDSRPGEVRRSALNYAAAKRHIGWEPKVKFVDGVRKTLQWFSNR